MFKDSLLKPELKSEGLAPSDIPRKLTARDVALGIGRKATEEEMEEFLSRAHGKSMPLKNAIENIKQKQ